MISMFCRNRVEDYARWRRVFDSHAAAHRAAGLHLVNIWRDLDDSNNIYFLFNIESLERARAFVSAPEAAESGAVSGVMEGEMHFLKRSEL
jgi:hypothetical protein